MQQKHPQPMLDKKGRAKARQSVRQLEERLKKEQLSQIEVFKNREPKWNADSQMFQLDLRIRRPTAGRE